ncbi:hypothetical protein ACXYMX_09005 [Sporosarcina sp. CAU 1771]
MKKAILFTLFCFCFLLAACSQSEEDTQVYTGIIGEGKAMGYAYSVSKEESSFSWKVAHKSEIAFITENAANEDDLNSFRNSVEDSKEAFAKLLIWGTYLVIIGLGTYFIYKKKRIKLNNYGIILAVFAGIALYLVVGAFFDLTSSLQLTKSFYLTLVN